MVTPPRPAESPDGGQRRYRPGPATAAFVAVVVAVGAVTRAFGIEAGLLTTVLAVVALVIGPYVYTIPGDPTERPGHTDDHDDPDPGDGTREDRSAT